MSLAGGPEGLGVCRLWSKPSIQSLWAICQSNEDAKNINLPETRGQKYKA